MATKVEKRQERKKKNLEALGIDIEAEKAKEEQQEKKGFLNLKNKSSNKLMWTLFLIQILLLMFIFQFS